MTDYSPTPASKPWWSSTTLQGAAVGLFGALQPTIAGWLGMEPTALGQVVNAGMVLFGFVMTVIGRFKAKAPLH